MVLLGTNLQYIWCKYSITIKINAGTAPSKGNISTKLSKKHFINAILTLFLCNKVTSNHVKYSYVKLLKSLKSRLLYKTLKNAVLSLCVNNL